MTSIVHLTSAHPRDDVRVFLKECRSLKSAGYGVTLVVADGLGDATRDGVDIVDVGCAQGRLKRMLYVTSRVFAKAVALDADLYHLHDPELIPVGLRLKRLGKRVIFDSHEDVPLQLLNKHYLPHWILRVLSFLYGRFERFACAQFDGVIAATPHIRDKFLEINPHTVDVCNFPELDEFSICGDWASKRNEVCYVGGISMARGAEGIINAMSRLKTDMRLNLVGAFSEPRLKSRLENGPGWDKVNETGVLDRAGVCEIYKRSMAGLVTLHPIPNYLDALPIKMFEYMSAGIPVIASDFPLWREIVHSADCGLCVNPLDPESIANAIDAIGQNPERARKMGLNGRVAVETRFNWKNEETKLVAFYQQLLFP